MPTVRVLPNGILPLQTTFVNGREYSAAPGQFIDVPDFDAAVLLSNGWIGVSAVAGGPSAERPAAPYPSQLFHDTTIDAFIIFDGVSWRDVLTANAV